ncbi:MAG: UbiA family prenyltransferase [Salibacteraceae bacterium]
MNKEQFASYTSLFRWPNLLLIAFFFIIGNHLILGSIREITESAPSLSNIDFTLFVVDVLIVALAGYWINDYFDLEIDRINQPKRALPSGLVKPSFLIGAILSLVVLGLLVTFYLGFENNKIGWVWLYPLTLLALFFYAKYGKQWGIYGNILVSLFIASLPWLLLLSEWQAWSILKENHIDKYEIYNTIFWAYFILMFTSNICREIAKDAEDMPGDKTANARTFALKKGLKSVKVSLFFGFILVAIVQWGLYYFFSPSMQLLGFSIFISFILINLFTTTLTAEHSNDFKTVSKRLKTLMFVGLIQLALLPGWV